ncbi:MULTISPECIES: GNAT family N-acetyltransferase [Paenibacillus]|uniref:Acetyltransferase n=1 Tax=Paenibacillus albilobatus TaxID=2716884 RepID=A0A919XKH2_9BACL|nr:MULTISPECIES: GNAT family N-acetyltransferase [Paenibacillus]GIO34611.1 acetyltransferase [Paenibacillus albilobatus]
MVTVVDVTSENIEEKGFFCMRSKSKTQGYKRKQSWLLDRFQEGLRLKIIEDDGYPRGFIEYIPVEYTWRGIQGSNYMAIHCLWIVGKGKGKGYGSRLLSECIADARSSNMSGVAMVTSSKTWLTDTDFFVRHGFELVDSAPPHFELVVKRFDDQSCPVFNHGWDERAGKFKDGITILKSDQCPYIYDAINTIIEVAEERGIRSQVVELRNSMEAQFAPSPYGVFNVIYNGKLLTYHPVSKRELIKLLEEA